MTGRPPETVPGGGGEGKNRGKLVEKMFESAVMVHKNLVKERKRKEADERSEWKCKNLHKKAMWVVFEKMPLNFKPSL